MQALPEGAASEADLPAPARGPKLLEVIVPHARPPVLLSLYTGLRRDNALHIIWDQIWLDAERPFAEVLAKGDKRHVVWLPAEAVALLSSIASGPAPGLGLLVR